MDGINEISCLTTNDNTGVNSCPVDVKFIVGVIFCPKGYSIPLATLTTAGALQTKLLADAQHTFKAQRIYPFCGFNTINDGSEDLIIQTMGDGSKEPVRDGFYDWLFDFINGALTSLKNLTTFNGRAHDFLFIDSESKIIGTKGVDNTGLATLKAIPSDGGFFRALPWKAADGSKVARYMVRFSFAPDYINKFVAIFKAPFDIPSTIKGLQTAYLTSPSANVTSGSYNVVIKDQVGTNIVEMFDTELPDITCFTAKKETNGAAIPILSATLTTFTVSGNSVTGIVLAVDKTSPNYPSGASEKVVFNLVDPTTLASKFVPGYEGSPVSIVKN